MKKLTPVLLVPVALLGCKTNDIDFNSTESGEDAAQEPEGDLFDDPADDVTGGGGEGGAEASLGTGGQDSEAGTGGVTGSGGSPPIDSYCSETSAPSDVLESDYTCVDFDNGLPTEWSAATMALGELSVSQGAAYSAPSSLELAVEAGSEMRDVAQLTWTNTGGESITAVDLDFQFMTTPPQGVLPDWSNRLALACLSLLGGNGRVCLEYSDKGLFLDWSISAGRANGNTCQMSSTLLPSAWNKISLRLDVNGHVSLQVGNQTAETCENESNSASGVDVTVGFNRTQYQETGAWSGNFDNLEVSVFR